MLYRLKKSDNFMESGNILTTSGYNVAKVMSRSDRDTLCDLFSAAPEMLEQLKACYLYMMSINAIPAFINEIKTVIDKAEGK